MATRTLLKNITIINEGQLTLADILIEGQYIKRISAGLSPEGAIEISGIGKFLFPGVIDGQVHFRDPGLTHKGDINSESRAAVAGGVTSFIDMPNTLPNVLSIEMLEEKNKIASKKSVANYGFFFRG